MPKGMTPKKRMMKTTVSLARSLKPSGRLNADDIKRAGKARKKMSLSEIKKRKLMAKIRKQEPIKLNKPISSKTMKELAGMLGLSVGDIMSKKVSDVIKRQEKTKRPGSRPNTNSKTKTPSSRPSNRRPMGTKALGPVRPIRERSQSKLVSRRRGMGKR